MACQYQCSLY